MTFKALNEETLLLKLSSVDCDKIASLDLSESDAFDSAYWILHDQFEYINDTNSTNSYICGLGTYFENKPYKIDLRSDRLYVEKASLLELIGSEAELWKLIDKVIAKDYEDRVCELKLLDRKNANGSGINKTNLEPSTVDLIDQSNNQKNVEKSVGILSETSFERDNQLLTRTEVMNYLRIGKSTMYSCMRRASKNYDPDFPQPVGNSSHKKFWVKHEVTTYQEIRMNRRAVSDPVS